MKYWDMQYQSFLILEFSLFKTKNTSLHFRAGTGLAYITKKYEADSNLTNTGIGSHWNNVSHLSLSVAHQINIKK